MKFASLRIPLFVFLICIIALTESGSRNTASRKGKASFDNKNVLTAQGDDKKSGTKSRVSFAVQMGAEGNEAQKSPSMRKPVQTKKVNPKEVPAKIVKPNNAPISPKQSMAEMTQPIVKSKTVKKPKPVTEQNPKLKKSKSTGNTASSIYSNGPSPQAVNGSSSSLFGKTRHQECMAGAQKVRYQDCQALRVTDVCPETLPMAVEVNLKEGKRCQLLTKAKNGKGYVVADENGKDVPVRLTSCVMCCKHKEFYDPFNNKYQLSEDNEKEEYKGQDKPGKLSDVTLNRLERMGKFNERVDVAKNELAAEMREAEARRAKRVKSAEALTQGPSQTKLPRRKSTRPAAEGKNNTKDVDKMAETKEEKPPTQEQQSSMLSRFYTSAKNAAWQTAKGVTGVVALTTGISALSGAPKVALEQNGATAGGQIMAVGGGSHAVAGMPGGVGSAAFDGSSQLMATSGLGRSNTNGHDGLREAVQGGNGFAKGLDKFHAQNLARMGVSPKNYYKDLEKIKEIENYGKETAADDDGFQQENNEHGNDIREFEAPTEEVDSNYGMDHEAENVAKSLNKFDHNGNVDDASEAMESPSELLDVNPVAEKMAKDDYGSTKLDANEPVENESDSGLESFKEYKEAAKSETEANHHYGQTQTFDEENHKEEMNSVTQNDLHESAQHNFPANYDMPVEKNELFEKAELEDGIKPNGYFRLIFRSAEETLSAERARMYE